MIFELMVAIYIRSFGDSNMMELWANSYVVRFAKIGLAHVQLQGSLITTTQWIWQ